MKTICNITTTHTRHDHRVFLKECITEKRNYEVCLVVSDGKPDELKEGVYIYGTKRHKTRLGRAVFSAFQVYRKAKSLNADIYVFHEHDLLWLALFLKKNNKVVLWDCHEAYSDDLLFIRGAMKPFSRVFWCCYKILSYVVTRNLDGCITVCNMLKTRLLKLGCKRCYILHNYASKMEFRNIESQDYDKAQCVLYIGYFEPSRCIHTFIQAINRCKHKNIKLIIGANRAQKKYEEYCKQLACPERVIYHRNMNRKLLIQTSRTCFSGLISYASVEKHRQNASPVKFYEYMALSLPVIFANVGKFYKKQLDNDGHPLGFYINSDPQAIADAIDYLYENKEVARTMGMNGRKAFETKYNFESEADGFLKFLEEVSQSKKSSK